MSAFMVNDGTIDRAVSAIVEFSKTGPVTTVTTTGAPVVLQDQRSRDALGRVLINLNQEALKQRYGDEYQPVIYTHRDHSDADGEHRLLAMFKAVACLTYQCSEGNVPELPLFKLLQAIEEDLGAQIVCTHNLNHRDQIYELPAFRRLTRED